MEKNNKPNQNNDSINEQPSVNEAPQPEAAKNNNGGGKSVKESFRTRAFRAGSYSFIVSIIVLAIAVVVNVLVKQLPSKYTSLDLTEKEYFTISDQTEQLVSGLTDEVVLYWLVETGTEDPYIEQILNRYEDLSDNLKVEKIDYIVFPSFSAAYTDETVSDNSVIAVCGDNSRYIDYDDIYVQDNSANVGFTVLDFYGEQTLTNAIVKITSGDTLNIYELSGHGEKELSEYSQELANDVLGQNYAMATINLTKYDAVPGDCACLLLTTPQSDLAPQEVDMIIEYLQNGGKMIVVNDLIDEETPNLDELLAYYGIEVVEGIVVDNNVDYYYKTESQIYLMPQMNTHVITNPLTEYGYSVLFPAAQGIGFLDNKRDGVYYGKFLTTSDSSYSKVAGYQLSTYVNEDGDIMGPFTIGCTVTETVGDQACRLCIYTTTFMLNDTVNEMVSGANFDLFLNTVDWCCDREENISIHPKNMNISPLEFTGTVINRLFFTMVIAIPLVPLVVAVVVTTRRRRR